MEKENFQYTVKITTAITGVDLSTGEYFVVSLDNDKLVLPFIKLQYDITIDKILEQIYTQHIHLDSSWIIPRLTACVEDKNTITVLYECMIPLDTTLSKAYWIPLYKCTNNSLSPYMFKQI